MMTTEIAQFILFVRREALTKCNHMFMDKERRDPGMASLHRPKIRLLQRHKTNEAAGLQ